MSLCTNALLSLAMSSCEQLIRDLNPLASNQRSSSKRWHCGPSTKADTQLCLLASGRRSPSKAVGPTGHGFTCPVSIDFVQFRVECAAPLCHARSVKAKTNETVQQAKILGRDLFA